MTTVSLLIIIVLLAAGIAVLGALYVRGRRRPPATMRASESRILFPFVGNALSLRALDGALRLATADEATLVPVFLARVPMQTELDAPLLRQCAIGMPLLETIEQRATAVGVPVDARVARGRTHRHALREAIEHERFDRIVVAAATSHTQGFDGADIAWLLDNAPGEVIIVRPEDDALLLVGKPTLPPHSATPALSAAPRFGRRQAKGVARRLGPGAGRAPVFRH
jgi:hypothetical protein